MGNGNVDKVQGQSNSQIVSNQSLDIFIDNLRDKKEDLSRILAGLESASKRTGLNSEQAGIFAQQQRIKEEISKINETIDAEFQKRSFDNLPLAELERILIWTDTLKEGYDINGLKANLNEYETELENMEKTGLQVSKSNKNKEQLKEEKRIIELQLKTVVEFPAISSHECKRDLVCHICDKATKLLEEDKLSKEDKSKLLELLENSKSEDVRLLVSKSEYVKLFIDKLSKSMSLDSKGTEE